MVVVVVIIVVILVVCLIVRRRRVRRKEKVARRKEAAQRKDGYPKGTAYQNTTTGKGGEEMDLKMFDNEAVGLDEDIKVEP